METWTLLEKHVHAQLKFYSLKRQDHWFIDDNIDDFPKSIGGLSYLSIKVWKEVQEILIINALPIRYDQLKEALKYSRKSKKVDDIVSSTRYKEEKVK